MSLRLYVDEQVQRAITDAIRVQGVDVLTVKDDGHRHVRDPVLLDRATGLGRVMFTQDEDLLTEGVRRQRVGQHFAGVIFGHQHLPIRVCVDDIVLLVEATDPEEFFSGIEYLPLR